MEQLGSDMMLCEECKTNEAKVLITMLVENEKRTRYLCQSSVNKIKEDFQQGNIESFLSSLMALMPKTSPEEKLICSVCGLSFNDFQKTGKLGCAQCYIDFKQELEPLLRRIHGRNRHAGRIPQRIPAAIEDKEKVNKQEEVTKLRKEMEKAVLEENFEEAALLRDKIKIVEKKEEEMDHEPNCNS